MRDVKLNQLHEVIETLEYPIEKAEAREELSDVRLVFADGEEALSDVLARSNVDRYGTSDDLESEVYSHLPVNAVGEPGQSEGDS